MSMEINGAHFCSKITGQYFPQPEKDSWDKQWIKQEFDKGVVKVVFKDMIGEKGHKYLTLSNPPRIFLDLKDPKHLPPSPWYQLPLKGWAFRKMRVGTYSNKIRFVLDLTEDEFLKHTVHTQKADLIVTIGPFSRIFQATEISTPAEKSPSVEITATQPLKSMKKALHQPKIEK